MFIKFRQEQSVDLLGSECSRMENWELTLGTNFKTRYPARSGGPGDVRAIHATQAARLATADSATKKRRALLGLKPHLETPNESCPDARSRMSLYSTSMPRLRSGRCWERSTQGLRASGRPAQDEHEDFTNKIDLSKTNNT